MIKHSTVFFSVSAVLLLVFAVSCSKPQKNPHDTKMIAAAGLPPTAALVKMIGGEKVQVLSLLPPGRTPHDFTPRTSDIRDISRAQVFFSAKMPFEMQSEKFFSSKMPVADISDGIKRISFSDTAESAPKHHHHCDHHHCNDDGLDPHIWLSPENALIISKNICKTLCQIDPDNAEYYRSNAEKLKTKITVLAKDIRKKLAPFAGRTFFIYHPALGYFAKEYNLKQRAVELNGREISAPQLAQLIKEARNQKASTIFVQKEFNPNTSRAIARQINGTVTALNPLEADILLSLEQIANALADGFQNMKE